MNIAYIRVSTNKQELDSQKLEIMEYCHKNNIILDEILEVKISSTKSQEKRKIKD
ncbi:recombinase family protein, partial [Campylobacter coli]|nr:recombinase family protein [Campylobacter coli]